MSDWVYRGSRYRWQRVCHNGECNQDLVVPWEPVAPWDPHCTKCYPFAYDTQGELIRFEEGECTAAVHSDTRHVRPPRTGQIEHMREAREYYGSK